MQIRNLMKFLAMLIGLCLLWQPAAGQLLPTARPGPDAAQVTGSPGFPGQGIFSVRFVEINGRNIQPREVIWLEPGSYQFKVTIKAWHTRSSPRRRARTARDRTDYNVIELELEAGKNYHVRARYNPENPGEPYSVILYRVDD
jgi:hypothetical protein